MKLHTNKFVVVEMIFVLALFASLALSLTAQTVSAQQSSSAPWHFLASGDSRNCGDVVMPGIAETARKNQAAFYWHLGDLRQTSNFDEDITHQPEHMAKPMSITEYESIEWPDYIQNQIAPFGNIPFFLGIGNHETVQPYKTREEFLLQFADWLDSPVLHAQRLKDDPSDFRMKTYFHWIDRGVAFYYLDSATAEQFDAAQLRWFERVLAKDLANPDIKTIVVGMHKALPESISAGHSMNESATGTESGRRVYADLLRARDEAHKHVYVLASHSHYFMDGIFNTEYWKQHGGVLPGWIVGTGGAVRYPLPSGSGDAHIAVTNVYGSLLATVKPNGEITFEFQKLEESDVPAQVTARYGKDFVHWCFAENSQAK
ncbi:MAG TPA: metallophosphoesterase [Candidatus Acidoferrales bacterium]|nr:metallophosphoesterase [Candidatus Acidoferrales bacterium]